MKKSDEARISRLLQESLDNLCADAPDIIDVYVENGRFRCDMVTWSPALTRYRFRDTVTIGRALRFLGPQFLGLPLEALVMPLVECLFGHRIETMKARHASAVALGLVQTERYLDLPFARMAIDAPLLRLFDKDGSEIRQVAAEICGHAAEHMLLFEFAQIRTAYHGSQILVADDGADVPVISAWHPVGRALYNGTMLEMPDIVPATLASAVIGRPVDALVDTGRGDINAKTISSVEVLHGEMPDGMPWPDDQCTRITFEPDLVELGIHVGDLTQPLPLASNAMSFLSRSLSGDWDVWAKYAS